MTLRLKKSLFIFLIVAGALAVGIAAYYYRIPEVRVIALRKGSIREFIEETGYVRTGQSFDLQAPIDGKIIRLNVSHGQTVKSGQEIIALQNIAVETQLAEIRENIKAATADLNNSKATLDGARADLEDARKDIEREAGLLAAGAISRVEYEAVESRLRKIENSITSLQAGLEGAEHRLAALQSKQKGIAAQESEMVVACPIDGRILSLAVRNGQVVSSGTILATVGSRGGLEVYAEILSDEIVRLHTGQPVQVTLGADSRQQIAGRIKEIYPQAVEKLSPLGVLQRRVPILVALDGNGLLKPGYEVNLNISTAGRDNVLLAPREAISVGENGSQTVKTIQSGRVVSRKIVTGLKDQYYAEVLQGLSEGEPLIRDGALHLADGARVRLPKER